MVGFRLNAQTQKNEFKGNRCGLTAKIALWHTKSMKTNSSTWLGIWKYVVLGAILLSFLAIASTASATNSWNGYHWARTTSPFTLQLGKNLSSAWAPYLDTTSTDWSISTVLNTTVVAGRTKPKPCKATTGRVEVCNRSYGNNGWLGVAQIWASGKHITQGTVKVNDFYFNLSTYNTPAWRNMVMCQEVGHTLGLAHQDEAFDNPNLGTCMDYTNDPARNDGFGDNQHPNQHDYDELGIIYAHLDSTNTVFQSIDGGGKGKPANVGQNIDLNDPSAWGQAIRQDAQGKNSLFERDLGNGEKLFTFVIWAE